MEHMDTEDNLLELVNILEQVNETSSNARLNEVSAHNFFLESKTTNTSELRTYFYHYKTLKKKAII